MRTHMYVLHIPMHIIKGDRNWAVSGNNRKKAGPMSVLGGAR